MRSRWAKEEAPPARGTDEAFGGEPYLEERFPCSSLESSIHFAGSLSPL